MHSSASARALIAAAAWAASAVIGSSPVFADMFSKQVINTYKDWDGSQNVGSFGCPNTTTYGQVITIPKGMHTLKKFSFWWRGSGGSLVVRAEVFPWDGAKAFGGSLYESAPRTISYHDNLFHEEDFEPFFLGVLPGSQYVIFASIDKDYEQCSQILVWGDVADSVYKEGTFVYQNNGGDESQWTKANWTTTYGTDLVFKAFFSP